MFKHVKSEVSSNYITVHLVKPFVKQDKNTRYEQNKLIKWKQSYFYDWLVNTVRVLSIRLVV